MRTIIILKTRFPIGIKSIIFCLLTLYIYNVSGQNTTGPLSKNPSNPRYFTDGSGKAVYLTGSHTWNNFATDQGSTFPPIPLDYNKFLDFLQKHNHNFFRINLASTTPEKNISSTGYCLVNPGKEYLIYKPDTVNLFTVKLIKGRYNYEWYNPTTGIVAKKGKISSGGSVDNFTPPFKGDAVLYLKKQ